MSKKLKLLDALTQLKDSGYSVPDAAMQIAQEKLWEKDEIVEVYECEKCKTRQECFIKSLQVICSCGRVMKLIYKQ